MIGNTRPNLGSILWICTAAMIGGYFTFAAVQGDNGLLRRKQFESERAQLQAARDALAAELAQVENRTRRLSDAYLDLDLLDEQVRDVLGYMRGDEIVIR